MKKILILLVSIFPLMALSAKTQGIDHRLYPTDDTYVYSDNTIRGMEPLLKTYHSTSGNQFRRISFLKFDLSGMSEHVESVKLRLYVNAFSAGGDNEHKFDLYPVSINTWSEDDITFNNYKDKVGDDLTTILASYTVPAGQGITSQYIEFSGTALTKYITDSIAAGKQYISLRMREAKVVKNGANAVVVEFHSKENPSGFAPELVITEKDIEQLKVSEIKVDNVLINNFSENTYRYVVKLPYDGTAIPTVSATAKYPASSCSIQQATSLTGTETQRTAKVTIQGVTGTLVYSVVFEKLPPPNDARLSEITVNGKPLEFFSMDKDTYTVYLPYTENGVPVVNAETFDPNATKQIVDATKIDPANDMASRTTSINVLSGNKEVSKTYFVVFEKLPELDIILAIGQSNMAGRAPFADVTAPMQDVYLLTPACEMEISSNPMNKYSNIRKDLSIQGLSPAYTCATTLQGTVKKPFGFVVNAQGGSSIITWYQPGKSNYDATIIRAKEAQRFGKIKAVIWHQGESDKGSAANDNYVTYKSNMTKLVQNLRADLNEPDLLFVCGELSQLEDREEFNRMVIQTVASYIPNSDYVTTTGTALLSDNTHFDEPSVKILGQRYAEKIIEHLYSGGTSVNLPKENILPTVITNGNGLILENSGEEVSYNLYNISGASLKNGFLGKDGIVNISIPKGFYILSFTKNQQIETKKTLIH